MDNCVAEIVVQKKGSNGQEKFVKECGLLLLPVWTCVNLLGMTTYKEQDWHRDECESSPEHCALLLSEIWLCFLVHVSFIL